MQQSKFFVIVIAGLATMFVLACIVPTTSSAQGADFFDKFRQCKVDCNEAYGGLDIFPSPRAPQGHADCMLKCERRFWKDFDKDTRVRGDARD